ncbi:MAG: malonate decarboxylase subunit alpha [Leptospiraceae bacterium]|nr:malonate decarboxylase subunit alpha [Leptospiraceae bacterium]
MYQKIAKEILYDIRKKAEQGILQGEEFHTRLVEEIRQLPLPFLENPIIKGILNEQIKQIPELYNTLLRINYVLSEIVVNLLSENSERFIKNLIELLDYRIHWDEFPTSYKPSGIHNPKIVTAKEAVSLINDNSVVYTSGFAANGRCSIFFRALREVYLEKGHPKNLTWISVSAQGGRGKAPGTIEELDVPGLLKEYICGHLETAKKLLKLAEEGHLELHTMPQGELTFLIEAQKKGVYSILSDTGIGTFLDPRVGSGSRVTFTNKNYINVKNNLLEYSLPKIEYALISAPYADEEGNVYLDKAAVITEIYDAIDAVKYNKGLVLIAVSDIIPKNKSKISIPSEKVDRIVVNPKNEQVGGVKQRNYWKMFLPKVIQEKEEGGIDDINFAVSQVKIINNILGITPYRREIDNILALLATYVFVKNIEKGSIVNIGIGLPEEVSRILYETGLYKDLIFTTESGVYGGLPVSGIFFGAAVNPDMIQQSSWMFHQYEKELDVTVLGMLETDSEGNVNVSAKGPSISEFVGPGGFPNITKCAKTIIFIGPFMWKSKVLITEKGLNLQKPGKKKFVSKVSQITFNAKQALAKSKKVFYVTDVGIFKLTDKGLLLTDVLPGIDVEKDILANSDAVIHISDKLNILDISFVTGKNFSLGELKSSKKKKSIEPKSKTNNNVISLVS